MGEQTSPIDGFPRRRRPTSALIVRTADNRSSKVDNVVPTLGRAVTG